jgi:multimeric flavodoxin WrbA
MIGFGCSPHRGNHTDILVRRVLKPAEKERASVEFIKLSNLEINYVCI